MKNLFRVLLLLIFAAAPFSAYSAALQYDNQLVERITIYFEGKADTSPAAINTVKSRMKTREGDYFSQAAFDNDLKTLVQDYDRVEPELISEDNKMHLVLHIWTKPTIRQIYITGNEGLTDKALREELGISTCSVFDRVEFNRAFHKLKAYYVKQGYFEAKLNYSVAYDADENVVDVNICVDEGRAGWIKNINFCGFTPCEEAELIDLMFTKKYNFFLSWFTGEGTYHEEMIQQDQFVILNYLQNHGYADAVVRIDVADCEQNNRININISAEKGRLYRFGDITFEGNTLFCDDEVRKMICAQTDDPFSADKLRTSTQNITNLYGRKGYIDAIVNFEPCLDPDCCVYSINFTIEEGSQYCVGLIKVIGNCQTQTTVILHETLLIPGEIFNLEKLQITEARLRNIGFFKNVNVYAVRSDAPTCLEGNYRDVHIEVEECSTGNISLFAAYSTVESLFGGITLTEKNFNAEGLRHFGRDGFKGLRGGGEFLSITGSLGLKSRKYMLSWTKPHFMDTPWAVGFDVEQANTRYISNDYEINAAGFSLFGMYQYNAYVKFGCHYRFRYSDVTLDGQCNKLSLQAEKDNSGIISAVGTSIIYDSTDRPMRPSHGFKSRLENEIAGIAGNFQFVSLAYLNSYYYSISKDGVLKFRADARFILPFHSGPRGTLALPLDERFFLGGDNEIRGYTPYQLGPQFCPGEPSGGISMQVLSIEYDHRIFSCLDAFIFCDSGSLTEKKWNFGRQYTSLGFGVRFKAFEAGPPITMGLGYPVNAPKEQDVVTHFFVSLGGKF